MTSRSFILLLKILWVNKKSRTPIDKTDNIDEKDNTKTIPNFDFPNPEGYSRTHRICKMELFGNIVNG